MTSFGVTLQNGTSTRLFKAANKAQQVNALVDTGATNSYLPWAIVDRFVAYTKAYDVLGELQCDCKWREDAGTIDFGFNDDSVKMRVPISDFIFPLGDGRCVLGMQKREGNENDAILGQTFLRGVYGECSLCFLLTVKGGGGFCSPLSSSLPPFCVLPPLLWLRPKGYGDAANSFGSCLGPDDAYCLDG